MATMRAKMKVNSIQVSGSCEVIRFSAVCKKEGYPDDGSDENNSFARWTPQADLSMTITNPDLLGKITEGQEFYLDFTPAGVPEQSAQEVPTPVFAENSLPGINQSEEAIEAEIQSKGLNAPRVKPEDITANIVDTEFVTHVSKSGQVLRWAVLTVKNGFAVVGKPSVAVSSANDNEKIGRQAAYDNARDELWPLMGYALKQKLHEADFDPHNTIDS